MPDYDEHEPDGEATGAIDPFDAFRARREQERAQQEPFTPLAPPPYEQYTQVVPPMPFDESATRTPRRPLRSAVVFGGAALLAVGIGAGVWAVTNSSGGAPAAASAGTPSVSAPASPGSKAAKAGKAGKAVNARITVTSVGSDSFTGTTAHGETVVVHIATTTRFGTAARPFTRAQLVPGAKVVARLRKDPDGTVTAAVIASELAKPSDQPTAIASPAGT